MVMVTLQQLTALSSVRVFIHKDLRPPEHCQHGVMVNPPQSSRKPVPLPRSLAWAGPAEPDLVWQGRGRFPTCSLPFSRGCQRIVCAQAIAEVQRRMPSIPLLTERDLQIDRSSYKKEKRWVASRVTVSVTCPLTLFDLWIQCSVSGTEQKVLLCRKLEKFEEQLRLHPLAGAADLVSRLRQLQAKHALAAQVRIAKKEAKATSSIVLLAELRHRQRLLHRLECALLYASASCRMPGPTMRAQESLQCSH